MCTPSTIMAAQVGQMTLSLSYFHASHQLEGDSEDCSIFA